MIIDIPHKISWKQENKGNLLGTLEETFNVDLSSNLGYIQLSRRMSIADTDSSLTGLGLITNFVYFDGFYFASSSGTDSGTYDNVPKLFKGGDDVANSFSEPAWTGFTGDTEAGLAYYYSGGDDLYYLAGDILSISSASDVSFTTESTTSARGGISTLFNGRLYYSDANGVGSFTDPTVPVASTSGSSYSFNLYNGFNLTGLKASKDGIWISTRNDQGNDAVVYLWDGVTAGVADATYSVPDSDVMALFVKDDRPYIVTGNGLLMTLNGSYFEEVARFPFQNIPLKGKGREVIDLWSSNPTKWIHNNGIANVDNKLHFLVNPVAEGYHDTGEEGFGFYKKLSGIWCYDPEIGLYHRFGISTTDTDGQIAIQGVLKHVGALAPAGAGTTLNYNEWGKFICGVSYFTENNDDTEGYGIFGLLMVPNASRRNIGYLTTTRMYAEQITEQWKSVMIGFEDLDSSDKITVKYRTKEYDPIETGVTWASTTSFTSTDTDWATIKTRFDAGINQEVRVLYGNGAGVLSQIAALSEASGTYTVTLSETHTGVSASDTGFVRIENWETADTITSSDNDANNLKEIPINRTSQWIQYKLILDGIEAGTTFNNPVINRLISISEPMVLFK